ncbi:NAD-dependent epimerase/dehydratase family protein [Limnobacter sp.]|uniref:NAD-dependent epimerase/dehydratase family protein n=1 Tax=Limnobacter sp. TaxID=2003368 RepID=UPI00351935DB
MHTILGSNGQIGTELARALHKSHTTDIRLVSRKPKKVNESDVLFPADLMDARQTSQAVKGSKVAYLTAGLPMDTRLWVEQWPTIMSNVLAACEEHQVKLVFFDNTYMYPQTSDVQKENTPFKPNGKKGQIRAQLAKQVLKAMEEKRVEAVICRAPEFYGPGLTQSITNATVIEPLKQGKKAKVFLRDDTRRSLIYTPDASRAMALIGNTPDAFGQTWHLPIDDSRLTYKQLIELAAKTFGVQPRYMILKKWMLRLAGLFSAQIRDAGELLPRYEADNIFCSDQFKARFPEFKVTTIEQGLKEIAASQAGANAT